VSELLTNMNRYPHKTTFPHTMNLLLEPRSLSFILLNIMSGNWKK
jgi:hypothetical protein